METHKLKLDHRNLAESCESEIKKSLRAAPKMLEKSGVLKGESGLFFLESIPNMVKKIVRNIERGRSFRYSGQNANLNDFLLRRVRLISRIIESSSGFFVLPDDAEADSASQSGNEQSAFVTVRLKMGDEELDATPICNAALIEQILKHRSDTIQVWGTIVAVPKSHFLSQLQIYIDKVSPARSMLDLLGPPKQIKEEADRLLDEQGTNLFNYLYERAIKHARIVVASEGALSEAVRGMIISAASTSNYRDRNGKIHISIYSPPASGKERLGKILALLSPIYLHAGGGKLSKAGLAAMTLYNSKTGRWISKSGYLSRAHGGVFHLEDVHMMPKTERDAVWCILSPQMESGILEDSTAAMTTHQASTAIVLDWNMQSQVDKTKSYSAHEDIPMPGNIISRFDIIFELTGNAAKDGGRIAEMVEAHFGNKSESSTDESLLLKTVIAMLQDRFSEVDVSGITGFMTDKISEFHEANKDLLDSSDDFNSNFGRLFKSAAKLTITHARLHQRRRAIEDDAEFALEMLSIKFKSLRKIIPNIKINSFVTAKSKSKRSRQRWLLQEFLGKKVTLSEALVAHSKAFEKSVSDRNMRRDLDEVGKSVGVGLWLISGA